MNIDVKIFLEDSESYLKKIGDNFYSKVPYNKDLILLYTGSNFTLKKSEMDFVGVYSLDKKNFIAMSDDYSCRRVCSEYKTLTLENLNRELDERVQNELLAILQELVTPNVTLSNHVLNLAREFKMKGEEPVFSFHDYENAEITLETLEEFYADKDDYAYSIAEKVIQNQNECMEQYQEYVDVITALAQFSQKVPIDIQLEIAFKEITQESSYKNLKIHTVSQNGIREENISTNELKNYPPYAISKIYWGRKLLFDINDYDASAVDSLRTDVEYNTKMLENINGYYKTMNVFDYVDERLFDNYDFAMYVSKKHSNMYGRISENFRSSMVFIKSCEACYSYLFRHTPEAVILNNKNYFLNLLKTTPECYSDFPKKVRDDMDFICCFIRGKGSSAIMELPENVFQYDKVQEAFNDWFIENPSNLNMSYYNAHQAKISLLRDKNLKIYALNYSYFDALSEDDLNDKDLIMGFLERVEFSNSKEPYKMIDSNFIKVYQKLKNLKTDKDIVEKMVNMTQISESCWKILDDSMKTKNMQKLFVSKEESLLSLMDEDIKMEFVYDNPKKFLPLMDEKSFNYYRGNRYLKKTVFDEDLILDLMKVKGDDIDFLECLNYEQLSDEKFAWEMMKINRKAYCYLDSSLKNNKKFAMEAVKEFSVIPYLSKNKWSKSLFDDADVMKASLKQNPLDFSDIPQASRQTGDAPLLSSKDFVMYAVKLDSNNARYIDPKTGFLEDEDICYEAVTDDIDLMEAFAGKLFRNEAFVYRLCKGIEEHINKLQSHEIQEIWYVEVREKLMNAIPKKIKETNAFKAKFPLFVI